MPCLPEFTLYVCDHVHGQGGARTGQVRDENDEAGTAERLEGAVHKKGVCERVLDFSEPALVLAAAVPDHGEDTHDALQHDELQQRRVSEQRDGDGRQQREVRGHLGV